MHFDGSSVDERYFFHFSEDFLELDVLEMDSALKYALRDVPDHGEVLLYLVEGRAVPRAKTPKSPTLFQNPLLCTVDHGEGMVTGAGLGPALYRLLRGTSADHHNPASEWHEWVIERRVVERKLVGDAEGSLLPAFRVYSSHVLLTRDDLRGVSEFTANEMLVDDPVQFSQFSKPVQPAEVAQSQGAVARVTVHTEDALPMLQVLADLPWVETSEVDLHRLGLRLSLRSGFDELLSLQTLHDLTPFPHQIRTVERVLRRMRGRALLCDEVGLGKTIEAGIVLAEYMLRGMVKRALILTPPSLVEQWKEEVTRKLGLSFVCYDEARFRGALKPWQTFDHIIASLDTAKREPHRQEILETEYDLVIVDEAHHLKNRTTLAWKFVNQLKKKYILLLTATPIENNMSELFNLITLLRPGQLLTEAEYKRKYVDKQDPLQPKNVQELKQLVQSVMIRNRRSTTGVIQSSRTAETVIVPPDALEQRFYARLSGFVKVQLQNAHHSTSRGKAHPFVLKNILRQAGSSIACTLPTLQKLWENAGDLPANGMTELHGLVSMADEIKTSAKLESLLRLLESTPDQTLVFTGFVETQQAITAFLRQHGLDVVNFHGGMTRAQKEHVIIQFREGTRVLVSTESGGEGRNLQFCHRMVNFDIPWNPMRIEQRIGRIHRIGQQHEVNIYNLTAQGTMEEHILRILDAKINLFQLVVGELDMILGSLDNQREFEDILMDIWIQAKDEDELIRGVDALGDELLAAKTHYQKVREVDDRLLSELIEDE